jgi:hypothetical protein
VMCTEYHLPHTNLFILTPAPPVLPFKRPSANCTQAHILILLVSFRDDQPSYWPFSSYATEKNEPPKSTYFDKKNMWKYVPDENYIGIVTSFNCEKVVFTFTVHSTSDHWTLEKSLFWTLMVIIPYVLTCHSCVICSRLAPRKYI